MEKIKEEIKAAAKTDIKKIRTVEIRIPDYIAGTIAAWNIEDNKIIADHPKFEQVLERVIADNRNIPIIQMDFSGGTVQTQRLVVVRSSPTSSEQLGSE